MSDRITDTFIQQIEESFAVLRAAPREIDMTASIEALIPVFDTFNIPHLEFTRAYATTRADFGNAYLHQLYWDGYLKLFDITATKTIIALRRLQGLQRLQVLNFLASLTPEEIEKMKEAAPNDTGLPT